MAEMTPLATMNDLDSYHVGYKGQEKLAEKLLQSVSASIRSAAGQPISSGTYTVTIPSEASRKLDLPTRPVTGVSSVTLDGEAIKDWTLLGNVLYREGMWHTPGQVPVPVTVTFTAGYNPVPEDIVRLVCSFVSAGLVQDEAGGPGAHRDMAYERIDDAQVGYRQGTDEVVDATELPKATKDALRARFGSPGISIGVFR